MKPEELLSLIIPMAYLTMSMVESHHPARRFVQMPRWRKLGTLFFVMVLIVGSIVPLLLPLAWFKTHSVLDLTAWGLGGIPVGVIAVTFIGYWFHRAEHKFDSLWRAAHQLHHSPSRVDMAGAYFTHPLEVVLKVTLANTVTIYLLGLSPVAASAVSVIGALLSMWQHLNITTPYWLGYLIPRPESHVLHHERDVHARNYGDLPVWDMLFGTYFNPRQPWTGKAGLESAEKGRILDMLLMRQIGQ